MCPEKTGTADVELFAAQFFAVGEVKNGHKQDFDIKQKGPILNIVQIVFNASLNRSIAAKTVNLRPAGNAGTHLMLDHIQGDALLELVDKEGELRARANQTHITFEDIEKLRQLINGKFADKGAETGFAGIAVGAPSGGLLVIDPHGTEFVHIKRLFAQADTFLPEQDGAGGGELYADRREQHERRGQQDQQE